MTGPFHSTAPHDYIYDTIEESLSGGFVLSGGSTPVATLPGVAGETTTTTINTTAGGIDPVADVQTIINTGTTTPAPSPTPTLHLHLLLTLVVAVDQHLVTDINGTFPRRY